MATKGDPSCFVCGSADLSSQAQPRRRYAKLTTLFKTLVMTADVPQKLGGSSDLVESCAACLAMIKDVYDLRQEIVSLQTQLDALLEGARLKLGNIRNTKGLRTNLRNTTGNRAKLMEPEVEDSIRRDNDDVHIKEEFDDVFYLDAEIIPDSVEEMDQLSSQALRYDNDLPDISITQRNKPCLQYQNHSYVSYKTRGRREYWRCRTTKCTGRLIKNTKSNTADTVIISKEHTCRRSGIEFQVASLRDKLKSEALNNPFTGPSEIVSAVKANYSAEVIQAIPSDETLL
ncbi:hypothetical protein Fcan01_11708 [Folsomia candida]|uniref:FLYWCH-type domain-containing protein n=1 Tax=Folsomia candida TaxID=158441 RepID=A0A226EAJ7_FOLCA|nr:hypothetical protein Fcan01_11708 [Folsomia candida]